MSTSAKQQAREAVEQLPEDASLEDAIERLCLLAKIERGRADVAAGVHEHAEVRRQFAR
jgi:hypothetical protein